MNLNRRHAMGIMGVVGGSTLAGGRGARGQEPPQIPTPTLPDATLPGSEATAPYIPPAPVTVGPPVAVPMAIPLGGRVQGRMTGAQATVAALAAEGTACVFGVPGAQNNEFWDEMKSMRLAYLLVTNEYSASIMADAAARVTGGVGVFAVVPGPGLTNALTGIGEALYDSVPIVGIVTDVDRSPDAPVGQVHGLANAAILRPVCKGVIEVQHVGQIPGAIARAFQIARCGEPGPASVVIPYPLYNQVWDFDEAAPSGTVATFDEGGYRQAARLLANRKCRVGIYAGLGCMDAGPRLAAVAEMLDAPVATSVSGKGAISERHPLAVGWGYGAQGTRTAEKTFAKDVDVVLAVGVRYSENSTANYAVPKHKALIHVDANPNILGRNVPTDVGVCADSRVFLDRLLADGGALRRAPRGELRESIARRRGVDRVSYETPQIHGAVDPMVLCHQLGRLMDPCAPIFVDVTASVHWAAEGVEVNGPRRFFTPANNQSMGWTVPAAIGAQRMRPDRPVAAVVGDGCFLMTGLEASTAARACLPVKYFVLDDGAYHYMQMLQEPTFRRTTATEIARLDHRALAMALGLSYNCIEANEDIACGIQRALAMPGPVLTRVVVRYEGRKIRWLSALTDQYIDRLNTGQKIRMASRVVARSANPLLRDD